MTGELLADSYSALNKQKNSFSQLLNVHRAHDVTQIEIHTAEPLVPKPSLFEGEVAVSKSKKYKLPGSDQFPSELIQAGGETLLSEIHKLILFGVRKNCVTCGRSLLLYQFTRMAIKLTTDYRGIFLLSTSYKIVSYILSRLSP
jgi:hypothetical protein